MGLLVVLPDSADAQLGLGVGLGGNVCLPDRGADCQDVRPSAFIATELEYRLWEVLGVGVDFDYGWLGSSEDDITIETLHAMLALRGYLAFEGLAGGRIMEAFLGLAMGYANLHAFQNDTEFYSFVNSWMATRISTGALFELGDGLWLGTGLDVIFHHGGERCLIHPLGQQDCTFYDGGDEKSAVADLIRLRARLRYDFW